MKVLANKLPILPEKCWKLKKVVIEICEGFLVDSSC